jgi:putative MATE family efflux protein
MNHEASENKMGVLPINRLILTMGIPMVFSMIIQALYNIVDSYFVSQIPEVADYAMNALTLAFPIQMLIIAVGVGTGIGVNSFLSLRLGQGNIKEASHATGNAIFLGICTYIVFLLFGIFGVGIYLKSQTSNELVMSMGKDYLTICMCLSFGVALSMIYEKLLQSTGKTLHATIAQIAGALTNIVLDPILIFGLIGFKEMGIKGAAYATVIGQIVTLVLNMAFHYLCNKEIEHKLSYIKPNARIISDIYKVGIPAIIMQALMSFMTYGVNIILAGISENYVTAYGVYYKIQQFAFFAACGLNNALIPLVAYNYGKGDKKRVKDSIVYGVVDTVVIMLICMIGLELFAQKLAGIFALSPEILRICTLAMRIIALGYMFAGVNIAFQGIFQAMGKGGYSLIISLIRMVIISLPIAWIVVQFVPNKELVFIAFPIAELLAAIVSYLLYLHNGKNWNEEESVIS